MQVSLSELKVDIAKYLDLVESQDIYITKEGKQIAKLVSTRHPKVSAMKSVFGAIPSDANLDIAKAERFL